MFKTERSATAIQTNLAAIFVSMEISRVTWLITSLLPANGEKMSKYPIAAGDIADLFALFSKLQRASHRLGQEDVRNHEIIDHGQRFRAWVWSGSDMAGSRP
jgi:transposase